MALRDWIVLWMLGAIWGSSFLFNGILIREIGPLWVSAGRVGFGALGCWIAFFAMRKGLPENKSVYIHFFTLGVLTYAVPFALFPLSQQSMPSGVAAIINGMTPIMTVIISHFWPGGEKATWTKSLGVLAGFTGVTILTLPALSAGGASQLWAIGACLTATVCYAVSLNYTRMLGYIDPVVMAACALTGAAIAAIPLAYLVHGTPHLETLTGWGAMLTLGFLPTSIAMIIAYHVLLKVGATNFSIVTFIAPLSAITLGIIFLNETIKLAHILGLIGIFIGMLLIDGRILKRFQSAPAE